MNTIMTNSVWRGLATIVLLPSCIEHGAPADVQGERASIHVVTLAPAERHQTLEGFGAAIAFYIDRAVGQTPQGLYQVLFPELGLDILRLRNRYQRSDQSDANLAQEVEILQRATQALGHRPKIMLSSWSPPAALKANGTERCRGNDDCTLKKDNGEFVYDQFGDYWYDSLKYYASVGIVPDYVTIQNEPDFIPPDWEGCKFEPSETAKYPGLNRALEVVHERVSRLPTPPKLLGPEVVGVHSNKVANYARQMNLDLVYGVAHHLYEKGDDGVWDWRSPGPDSFIAPMKSTVAATSDKPLFQTEFATDEDQGVEGGFETAWLIHNSLVEEGVVAFLYWDLVWTPGHGLVSVDAARYKPRDQYYSLRHYARFTEPGDVRVGARADSLDLRASAFRSPAGDRLTVIMLNTGLHPIAARLDAGGFAGTPSEAYRTIYRPGASELWMDLGALSPNDPVPLPPRSIATVVLRKHAG
jgi:glucuronoarabinoxylan endo-1,4-beta-xylanase